MAVNVLEVRPDTPAVLELIAELAADLDARYPDEPTGGLATDPREYEAPDGGFVLATVDGRAAGCGGLRRAFIADAPESVAAELRRMYVAPWARGRGVARHILARLEDLARQRGYSRVRLEAGTPQPEALRLYETSGYRPIAPYGEYRTSPLTVAFEKTL